MKKILALILGFLLVFSLIGCKSGEKTSSATVWTAPSTVKFMQDEIVEDRSSSELLFEGIRGEEIGYQLMINATENINSFNFEIKEDLKAGDNILPKDCFEIFVSRFMEVYAPKINGDWNPDSGFYPDALVPIDRYILRREDKILKGNNQGIWVNLTVPVDLTAGEYKGSGVLTLNGQTQNIQIRAKIINVTLPEEIHARTAFEIWYNQITYGEGNNMDSSTQRNYYDFALSKRLSPTKPLPSETTDIDTFVENSEKWAKNPKLTTYGVPVHFNKVEFFTKLAAKNIALRKAGDADIDLFKKLYIYGLDEPTADQYDEVRRMDQEVYEAKKTVKPLLNDYPDLQDSLMKATVGMTVHITEDLYATEERGGVQTWVPVIWEFDLKENRDKIFERKNSSLREGGEDVWWYWCIRTAPTPSYLIDDLAFSPRILNWMQYDYQISGTVYWNICFNQYYAGGIMMDRDPYNDPMSWEDCNGDGFLCYPGERYGMKEPVSSIRLENIRDGSEDYEYLLLAESGINRLNESKNKDYHARAVLNKLFAKMYDGMVHNRDYKVFEEQRKTLLTLLDYLYNDEDKAVGMIEELLK